MIRLTWSQLLKLTWWHGDMENKSRVSYLFIFIFLCASCSQRHLQLISTLRQTTCIPTILKQCLKTSDQSSSNVYLFERNNKPYNIYCAINYYLIPLFVPKALWTEKGPGNKGKMFDFKAHTMLEELDRIFKFYKAGIPIILYILKGN